MATKACGSRTLILHNGQEELFTKEYHRMPIHQKVTWTMRLIPVGSESSDVRFAVLHR
jgi:hypothetical protein